MDSCGVKGIDPAGPHMGTVPSLLFTSSTIPEGRVPYLPQYPLGPAQAVSPQALALYVLNPSGLSIQYCLLARVALMELLNQLMLSLFTYLAESTRRGKTGV